MMKKIIAAFNPMKRNLKRYHSKEHVEKGKNQAREKILIKELKNKVHKRKINKIKQIKQIK